MTDADERLNSENDALNDNASSDADLTAMLDALRDDETEPVADTPFEPDAVAEDAGFDESASETDPASGFESAGTPEERTSETDGASDGLFAGLFSEPEAQADTASDEPTQMFGMTAHEEHPWADEPVGVAPTAPIEATGVIPPLVDTPREVDLGPTRRGRWWIWVLIALVLLAAIGAGVYAWWWTTERPIVAPDVVGKNPAEAVQILNDVGLRLGKVSEIPTDSAPAGTIITQKPEAGTRLGPDESLSFVVASAPEQARVPNVLGVSAEQAAATLAESRLRPFEVASYNTTVAAGFTIAQLPAAGTELIPGTAVAVIVSKGQAPSAATVPRIIGMSEADALTLLKAVGLQPQVFRSPDASLAAGVVGTQTPMPGVSTAPGSVVQVLVTQAAISNPVTVPDVTGDSRASALADLKKAGLAAQVTIVANPTVARGKVIAQMPLAGGRIAPKGVVGLLISRGNVNEGPVPSVVGSASAEATRAITAAGFRPVILAVPMAGEASGTVVAQFPAAQFVYPFRMPVVCLVAREPGQ